MYACYVDESGHCGATYDKNQPIEVVCGVMTDVTKLFKTQREHARMLSELNRLGIPVGELKASEAYAGRRAWSNVTAKDRDAFFQGMFSWFEDRCCKCIACPIDSGRFFAQKDDGSGMAAKLSQPYVAGAFNVLLAIQRLHRAKKSNKGKTIVVFDEQRTADEILLNLLQQDLSFTDGYTGYKVRPRAKTQQPRLDQIVDAPYFSKSHLVVLIQLADFAAYTISRHLQITTYKSAERYKGEAKKIASWYGKLGSCSVTHTALSPSPNDSLTTFLSDVRPSGWDPRSWVAAAKREQS